MKNIFPIFLLVIPCLLIASPPADKGYVLAWSDEFNGSALDTTAWSFDTSIISETADRFFTNGQNFTIENGAGVLWAKKERHRFNNYTSCYINTWGKKEFTYGYIEARIKPPHGTGLWPQFWTLGSTYFTGTPWPECGELAVYGQRSGPQLYNGTPGDNCYNVMCVFKSVSGGISYNSFQLNYTECLCNDYHLYAVEWDSLGIKYFFDGNKFFEYDTINTRYNFTAFHNPHYLIIDLEFQSVYSMDTSIFPQKMYVDYVRVYQKGGVKTVNPPGKSLQDLAAAADNFHQIKLYDLKGRYVGEYSALSSGRSTGGGISANTALPQGIYIARMFDGRRFVAEKIVVNSVRLK
jgi:beta-glucanase (GH16 family)